MSHLTSNTREVWVAAVYNENDERIKEGGEYILQESAFEEAHELVSYYVEQCGEYYYAKVEHRIVPIFH